MIDHLLLDNTTRIECRFELRDGGTDLGQHDHPISFRPILLERISYWS